MDTYTEMLFCSPLISVNVAHPLIKEIRDELTEEGRKFTFLCGHDANIASVLAALNYGDYLLPETVEQHTPIGVKLVFERWLTNENEAYYKINLVYQSTQQLRSMEQLTLENRYAQIGAYRSLSRTSFISSTGSNLPLATMEKILGVQPLIRITPCSFMLTGCC